MATSAPPPSPPVKASMVLVKPKFPTKPAANVAVTYAIITAMRNTRPASKTNAAATRLPSAPLHRSPPLCEGWS